MCQAIPREVLRIEEQKAEVLMEGRPTWVLTQGLPDIRVGDFVVVYAGQALERMDRDEAEALLHEIGDLDAMFEALMEGEAS